MSKLTKWFDATTKPAHKGVYEVKSDSECYSYWDGRKWSGPHWAWSDAQGSIDDLYEGFNNSGFEKQPKWRGLANKPKVK